MFFSFSSPVSTCSTPQTCPARPRSSSASSYTSVCFDCLPLVLDTAVPESDRVGNAGIDKADNASKANIDDGAFLLPPTPTLLEAPWSSAFSDGSVLPLPFLEIPDFSSLSDTIHNYPFSFSPASEDKSAQSPPSSEDLYFYPHLFDPFSSEISPVSRPRPDSVALAPPSLTMVLETLENDLHIHPQNPLPGRPKMTITEAPLESRYYDGFEAEIDDILSYFADIGLGDEYVETADYLQRDLTCPQDYTIKRCSFGRIESPKKKAPPILPIRTSTPIPESLRNSYSSDKSYQSAASCSTAISQASTTSYSTINSSASGATPLTPDGYYLSPRSPPRIPASDKVGAPKTVFVPHSRSASGDSTASFQILPAHTVPSKTAKGGSSPPKSLLTTMMGSLSSPKISAPSPLKRTSFRHMTPETSSSPVLLRPAGKGGRLEPVTFGRRQRVRQMIRTLPSIV